MDAVFGTYPGAGDDLFQSGLYYLFGLYGYIGRMDLHIYLSLPVASVSVVIRFIGDEDKTFFRLDSIPYL